MVWMLSHCWLALSDRCRAALAEILEGRLDIGPISTENVGYRAGLNIGNPDPITTERDELLHEHGRISTVAARGRKVLLNVEPPALPTILMKAALYFVASSNLNQNVPPSSRVQTMSTPIFL